MPGGGGCGAERPVNIAIAAVLSSVPTMTDSPPIAAARRRAGSGARGAFARNRTQPSCIICPVDRSVVSGLTRSSPMNGSRTNVPGPTTLSRHRLDHLLLARHPREVVLGGVEPVLADARVDRAPACRSSSASPSRSASPPTAGSAPRVEYGQSKRLERIGFGTSIVDAAEGVDHLAEPVEVDDRRRGSTCRPVSALTVFIASAGPPSW